MRTGRILGLRLDTLRPAAVLALSRESLLRSRDSGSRGRVTHGTWRGAHGETSHVTGKRHQPLDRPVTFENADGGDTSGRRAWREYDRIASHVNPASKGWIESKKRSQRRRC